MCTDETIHFAFVTQKPFQGRVYVKGRADDTNCREDFSHLNATNASYTIKLGQCGMQRLRSVRQLLLYLLDQLLFYLFHLRWNLWQQIC